MFLKWKSVLTHLTPAIDHRLFMLLCIFPHSGVFYCIMWCCTSQKPATNLTTWSITFECINILFIKHLVCCRIKEVWVFFKRLSTNSMTGSCDIRCDCPAVLFPPLMGQTDHCTAQIQLILDNYYTENIII